MKPKKRRIGIIGNLARTTLRFRAALISDLVQAGHEVFAFAPNFDEKSAAQIRALGAEPVDYYLHRTGLNPLHDLWALCSLFLAIRRCRLDVVMPHFVKPVIYGTLMAWLARVPRRVALIEGAGYAFDREATGLRRQLLLRLVSGLYRLSLSRCDRVIVLNQEDRQSFLSLNLARPDQLTVFPGIGVDLDYYAPRLPPPGALRFTLMARMIREKGVETFVEAATLIRARYPECRFLLLGAIDTGPSRLPPSLLKRWVSDGLVEWPGQVEDVRGYLAETSVFVLPSYYREGLPRSILEALAMGIPVITTDNTGCRDTLVDGQHGFIVPVRDAAALAAAMERGIHEPELLLRMGAAARERAERLYDVRRINALFLAELSP